MPTTNGDDILTAATTSEHLDGGDGNDILVLEIPHSQSVHYTGDYAGGSGTDTLRLSSPYYAFSPRALLDRTYSGLERLEYSYSSLSANMVAYLPLNSLLSGWGPNPELISAPETDQLILTVSTPGDYTFPSFTLTNWNTDGPNHINDDRIVLEATTAGDYTLRATAGHAGTQTLSGGNGDDTLIGSDGIEVFMLTAGADTLQGFGGDDIFWALNAVPSGLAGQSRSPRHFSAITIDGGSGADTLTITGEIEFDSLFAMNSVEEVYLAPTGPEPHNLDHFYPIAQIFLEAPVAEQLAASSVFSGQGGINIQLPGTSSASFDGSGFTFDAEAIIVTSIIGTNADDIIIGTPTIDVISGTGGSDVLTGGGGADIFHSWAGNDVITDFTVGEDVIALSKFFSFGMLSYFMSQVGNDVVIKGNISDPSLTLRNVSLSALTMDDFILQSVDSGIGSSRTGTGAAESFIGSFGRDIIDAGGGNDLIWTGAGHDEISAGDGDDIIYVNNPLIIPGNQAGSIDGGAGNDTLVLLPIDPDRPLLYDFSFVPSSLSLSATLTGIETVKFGTRAGESTSLNLATTDEIAWLAGVPVVGGDGRDSIAVRLSEGDGNDISMPVFNLSNWSAADGWPFSTGTGRDSIGLLADGYTTDVTLRASPTHDWLESLRGARGNDILLGGDGPEHLNGGFDGADQLFGGGGTDVFSANANYATQFGDQVIIAMTCSMAALARIMSVFMMTSHWRPTLSALKDSTFMPTIRYLVGRGTPCARRSPYHRQWPALLAPMLKFILISTVTATRPTVRSSSTWTAAARLI